MEQTQGRSGENYQEKKLTFSERIEKIEADHLLILLELFPKQTNWIWENFDMRIIKLLIDSKINIDKEKKAVLNGATNFNKINNIIDKEKTIAKDWLDKNKSTILNGKSLADLENFRF